MHTSQTIQPAPRTAYHRKGKALPVDPYSGDDPLLQIEDWLPGLQRAADWYIWTEEEQCLQLAGHLHSRALQEWNLLDSKDIDTFDSAGSERSTGLILVIH